MDTNSLTTAGCVLAFSVLVIYVLVLRALYRIADLENERDNLTRNYRCLSDRIAALGEGVNRELGSYKTTLTDLHVSVKKDQDRLLAQSNINRELDIRIEAVAKSTSTKVGELQDTINKINGRVAVLREQFPQWMDGHKAMIKRIDAADHRQDAFSVLLHRLDAQTAALTKRLDAVMEEWSTLRVSVEQLQKKNANDGRITTMPPTKEYQIDPEHVKGEDGVSLAEIVRRNRRRAMEALRTQQRIDLERCYMDAVKSQGEPMSRDIFKSKPPIDQVPNPGE